MLAYMHEVILELTGSIILHAHHLSLGHLAKLIYLLEGTGLHGLLELFHLSPLSAHAHGHLSFFVQADALVTVRKESHWNI